MLPRDSEGIERREISSLARRFHIELRADPPNYFRRVALRLGFILLRKSRLPVCTASTYVPNGSGGGGSLL